MSEELTQQQRKMVEDWYEALATGEGEAMLALQQDDVIYNIHGSTPVSGRFQAKQLSLIHI